jgi:hypothetical protein
LQIKEIIENCISFLNETSIDDYKRDIDEYNIWKAYSWIEYCILLVRLNTYNLLDEPSFLSDKKITAATADKKTKIKVDERIMIQRVRILLLNLNFKDEKKLIDSLREIRDLLKVIVKDREKKKHNKKQE